MAAFFKPYTNIKDFLYRFTLIKIGKLHIRFHLIADKDQSTLFHNHPFHYISVILSGGYKEKILCDNGEIKTKSHKFLSIICRRNSIFHRIEEIYGRTITLFIAYGNFGWKAVNTAKADDDGIYQRTVQNKTVWAKKENGIWHVGHEDKNKAASETRPSSHQIP
jgi:hypothetical protein